MLHALQRPSLLEVPASGSLGSGQRLASGRGAPIRVLYLMGHGFSGSTLLTLLLGCHPELAPVGELGIAERSRPTMSADDYPCSCRRSIRECPFWRQVEAEMAARGVAFDAWDARLDFRVPTGGLPDTLLAALLRGPLLESARSLGLWLVPEARRQLDITLDRIVRLAEVVTGLAGALAFVDASKRPERVMFMRRDPRLDVRVVHLVRDGRAVARSSIRNFGWDAAAAADSWLADNLRSERICRSLPPERWIRVRYEDLCADPPGTLARIHQLAGVAPQAELPRFREKEQHVVGNRMRLESAADIRPDERWREELDEGQRRIIGARTERMNRRYGYATD